MDRFRGVRGWARDIAIVQLAHRGEIVERPKLIGELLADADNLIGRPHVIDLRALRVLGLDQLVNAVERNAAIIADDATAAIGIGQPGDDTGFAAAHDFRGISVEYAVVVAFSIFREGFMDLRVGFETGGL